jgi:hypothetical protein
MNFKQFFLERNGHRHQSIRALSHGGALSDPNQKSMSLVAKDVTKKQMLGVNNPKLKRAKEAPKGTKVPLISTNLNKLKSAGSQIKFDKIGAGQSKTLAAGKNGERVKVYRDPVTKKLILKK